MGFCDFPELGERKRIDYNEYKRICERPGCGYEGELLCKDYFGWKVKLSSCHEGKVIMLWENGDGGYFELVDCPKCKGKGTVDNSKDLLHTGKISSVFSQLYQQGKIFITRNEFRQLIEKLLEDTL